MATFGKLGSFWQLVENLLFDVSFFMKIRTFYKKKLPLFIKKTQFCILIKNSNLKLSFYKKTPFLEIIETPAPRRSLARLAASPAKNLNG